MKDKKSGEGTLPPVKKEDPDPQTRSEPHGDVEAETCVGPDGSDDPNPFNVVPSVPRTPANRFPTPCPLGPRRVSQPGQDITRRLVEPGGYLDSQTGETQALQAVGLLPADDDPSSPLAARRPAPFPLSWSPLPFPTAPLDGIPLHGSSPEIGYTSEADVGEEAQVAEQPEAVPDEESQPGDGSEGRPGLTHTPSSQRVFFPENLSRLVANGLVTERWALAHQLPNMPSPQFMRATMETPPVPAWTPAPAPVVTASVPAQTSAPAPVAVTSIPSRTHTPTPTPVEHASNTNCACGICTRRREKQPQWLPPGANNSFQPQSSYPRYNGHLVCPRSLANHLPISSSSAPTSLTTPAPTVDNNQPNDITLPADPHAPLVTTPPRATRSTPHVHPSSEPHRQPADRIQNYNERRAVNVVRDMAQDATEAAMAALSRTTRERNETLQELEQLRRENKRLRKQLDEKFEERRK
ncbi:hypothetical protein FA13DRAFT_1794690 [Coprinellus micaceus]|uniref:Uncharacterized protein n=1 Tax=Coprinellus micaceus TaxID=71717 RepID=A0A4Y7T0S2_COPMI|nr:hypothetical protein FA13DRAFT_1794690 [Coprinellus micaceus]